MERSWRKMVNMAYGLLSMVNTMLYSTVLWHCRLSSYGLMKVECTHPFICSTYRISDDRILAFSKLAYLHFLALINQCVMSGDRNWTIVI